MFIDVFDAMDKGREPMETFYDGYVINAIIDACYASARSRVWEPVKLDIWRGSELVGKDKTSKALIDGKYTLVKEEKMPDGKTKLILKDVKSGEIIEKIK